MTGLRLAHSLSWIGLAFAAQQITRLGTNVLLALIVSPSVFGVMLILNTLRTGVEQITDVGIGQNIVFDPRGNQPDFYNTAWTIQILRGVLLFAAFLALSPVIDRSFGEGELGPLLPMFATIFIITGFATPGMFLLQKNAQVKTIVGIELLIAIIGGATAIGFALISPTATALVWALLASTAAGAMLFAATMNWRSLRTQMNREMAWTIVGYGKWVFLSTLLYFAATSFDRLYLAAVVPLSVLGVYGVARTFSEAAFQLAHKVATLLIFPSVSSAHHDGKGVGELAEHRSRGLLIAAVLIGVGIGVTEPVILALYDERYEAAAYILPILLAGSWFSIIAVLNEAVVFGKGKPALNAGANGLKFLWLLVTVPAVFVQAGLGWTVVMIALADVARYIVLAGTALEHKVRFFLQDMLATLLVVVAFIVTRLAIVSVGLSEALLPLDPAHLSF